MSKTKAHKFKPEEWDEDEKGDELHGQLFKKKKPIGNRKRKQKPTKTKPDVVKPPTKTILTNNIATNFKKLIGLNLNAALTEKTKPANEGKPKPKQNSTKKTIKHPIKSKASQKIKKRLKRLEKQPKPIEPDTESESESEPEPQPSPKPIQTKIAGLNIANLKKQLAASLENGRVAELNSSSLREKMMDRLNSARFRFLNEEMYTKEGKAAKKMFEEDPGAFNAYHQGYRQQVDKWPMNPLDVIITAIKKLSSDLIVADFGCGDANLAENVPQKVHSFDLVAANDKVVACDMARVPLKNASVDIAVFCLSLMGTNLKDYLMEANRVLKNGGVLKIAEVESRFDGEIDGFIQILQKYGFKNTKQDLSHNLFCFMDFKKEKDIKQKNKLPTITLSPCLYKKR